MAVTTLILRCRMVLLAVVGSGTRLWAASNSRCNLGRLWRFFGDSGGGASPGARAPGDMKLDAIEGVGVKNSSSLLGALEALEESELERRRFGIR
jgi:hypothetical protein